MPSIGDTRTIATERTCANGASVKCFQPQKYARTLGNVWLGGWVDDGEPGCLPCPTGTQPRKSTIKLCCFAGAFLPVLQNATGPGPFGAAFDKVERTTNGGITALFGPGPGPLAGLRPLQKCQPVKGSEVHLWIAALEKAGTDLRAMARGNEALQNDKAIACLKKVAKEFGWLGAATRVVAQPDSAKVKDVKKLDAPATPTLGRPG